MISYNTANSLNDLQGILELQKINLAANLSHEEIESEGFVTVTHTLDQLVKLNNNEKHIIVKDNDKIIGYLLVMTQKTKSDIPILIPMFKIFDEIYFNGKKIAAHNYIVIGQACIDKAYRGQGIFGKCYDSYKNYYSGKYDFAITEIAKKNIRSLNAHKRVGFKEISTYTSPDNVEWTIVLWNWDKR